MPLRANFSETDERMGPTSMRRGPGSLRRDTTSLRSTQAQEQQEARGRGVVNITILMGIIARGSGSALSLARIPSDYRRVGFQVREVLATEGHQVLLPGAGHRAIQEDVVECLLHLQLGQVPT
jgi:hypothetical protein